MEKISPELRKLIDNKNSCRQLIRDRIATLSNAYITEQSEKICTQIAHILQENHAHHVALFAARKGEVNLLPLLQLLPTTSYYFPRVCGPREMQFHKISNPSEFTIGKWGIREPHATALVIEPHRLDYIIVPGSAFSLDGKRLGYGGGFYDSLLPKTKAVRLAVCFPCQILETIPTEPHDCSVHHVITGES